MSDNKNVDNTSTREQSEVSDPNIAVSSGEVSSTAGSVKTGKAHSRISSSSERQIKFERAQKCLENAALVSKRIKEHRKATAELLGKPFEEDDQGDTASEIASTMSERTGYSAATDTSTTLSVQDALNIPGISESLANTLKQKELLMERIKQYKEISKRPMKSAVITRKDSQADTKVDFKKIQIKESTDVIQLLNSLKEKENAMSVMQVRIKAMENTILDLQEKITEKDQIIEAKNKATTLMSDSLSKKEKDSLVLLEDTRQQMIKMQENFINMEAEWKDEKNILLKQIEEKDDKITNLVEANTILEKSRFEISVAHSKLLEELEWKNKEVLQLTQKIEKITKETTEIHIKEIDVEELTQKEKEDVEEEKGSIEIANMVELTKKIELLEQLNCQIRQTNKELENKIASLGCEQKAPQSASPSKKGSPLPTRKGSRNTASKAKSPWSQLSSESLPQESDKKINKNEITKLEMVVQSLNKDILDKEYVISQKDTLITKLQSTISNRESLIGELKSQVKPHADVADVGIVTDVTQTLEQHEGTRHVDEGDEKDYSALEPKQLIEKLKATEEQMAALNSEIDAANKNMIKVKSNHKLKLKQMQKTIENFSKVSDSNAEIVKLNEELHQLSQKVAELEEEKGNLQLHLVDYDSGRLTESDVYKKLVKMENLAETRLKAISVLEAQKFDLVQELHELQQKNADMEDKLADMSQLQTEQVSSEMKSVQLEEQIDQLNASRKELELVIENLKLDKGQLEGTIKSLDDEKDQLMHKLENYIQENMELTDKLEKLSAEKVSSAESIEIVESLTTQEKLELEEYNKGMTQHKMEESPSDLPVSPECQENIEKLVEQSAELNRKIELFTQERQEVMEKMSKISSENESLHAKITELDGQCNTLHNNIELLSNEKRELSKMNEELNHHIEELKRERVEIMKESIELSKPASMDEIAEGASSEVHLDDKVAGEKGNNRTKSVKQLTKEILKLKNVIKEREEEIGDCQMKILALEEQQQKQNELIQINSIYESKLKSLSDENYNLKQEIESCKVNNKSEQQLFQLKQTHESLQQEMQRLHQDYTTTIKSRDARINELENVMMEYENQIYNYGNTLQQKDKDLAEYINQITKLNDVSQKLKSTIELLEEEKAKDPNGELVKTLNKQITAHQKKLVEYEDKLRILEEEKSQLLNLKAALENKNHNLETELKNLHELFIEKQSLIKELQTQQQKHVEEISNVMTQLKERDEEVHEVKLQLRKESIENEKLRTSLSEKDNYSHEFSREVEDYKKQLSKLSQENDHLKEQYTAVDTKNKALMEKLKKFAATVKKKSSMYSELEGELNETRKQLEAKNVHLEQLTIQVETLPALQEKLKYAEEELNRLQSHKIALEQQKSQELQILEDKLANAVAELSILNKSYIELQHEVNHTQDENKHLKTQVDSLNNKLADYEVEQKNNTNFVTKVTTLEGELNQKQCQISELLSKLEYLDQQLMQVRFGHDAKVQERDLYIESLEIEINKFKSRICRLEESISVMEDSRKTLERKADQLDSQLQEKQKAYTEYTSQEDQLVSRLAVLMDHDRVVEKQLHEIENDNKELQYKTQHLIQENQRLRRSLSDIQEHCHTLEEKASKTDLAEAELVKCKSQLHELEAHLKRITQEHQTLFAKKKHDIEEIESEFTTQIENAIKEKKVLSEKYEKMSEHITQLEQRLHEYQNNNEILKINTEELTRINHDLIEKSNREQSHVPDYTEQYVSEINKLNSILNGKNQEINELSNKIQSLQTHNLSLTSNLESKVNELNAQLMHSASVIQRISEESNSMKINIEQLQTLLSQKDDQIKQLTEKKTVSFEMSIPKTEGLVITSTIEPLSDAPQEYDISSIESQIVSGADEFDASGKHASSKTSEMIQKQSVEQDFSEAVSEPVVVAKKAYLCYKGEETEPEQSDDPFNSEEGWGFGGEELGEVTPGMSHMTNQIHQLQKDNDTLKADLDASNAKLLKALKKLKELKASNDMLSNELKISKQMSQSSFLDSAIEDELKMNAQELEKKVEELTADLNKEKREKEALRKQNEVLGSANDRLTEIKEKLDNDVELWKFKFKEANDKMSTLQWGTDSKDSPVHKTPTPINVSDSALKEEMEKLEKENDELQSIIDQLTLHNKQLTSQQEQLEIKIINLNKQLQQSKSSSDFDSISSKLEELQKSNIELLSSRDGLSEKLHDIEMSYNELTQKYDQLTFENGEFRVVLESKNKNLLDIENKFQEEVLKLKQSETVAMNEVSLIASELEATRTKLLCLEEYSNTRHSQEEDPIVISEKYSALEDSCSHLKHGLDEANCTIVKLETENRDLLLKIKEYEQQVTELDTKIQNLNTENDQLLSTVAELRSSVSSAVDQRGFEIAELWKQHLAQREADFQNTEQELRAQLSAFEAKYEQLLDSVQSSSQEETNKLVMMEQMSSIQNKLQDKEEHLRNLQDKYAEVISQIDMLRSEIEDEKLMFENKLLRQQEEYEKQIQELTSSNKQHSESYEEAYVNLQIELAATKASNDELNEQVQQIHSKLSEREEIILDLTNQVRMKDSEINQKIQEYTIAFSQRNEEFENIRKQLLEYEKKIEDLSYEKESDLAVMRLKMHENGQHYEKLQLELEAEKLNLTEALNAKIVECTNLNKQISDLNKTLEEQANNTKEMQLALENQEIEIVTLKDDISNLLKSGSKIEKHVTFASGTKLGVDEDKAEGVLNKDLLNAVPGAKLDLALYVLHQRDVQCDELTMELTRLLEERDTLQLRLSDSLRSFEELKSRCQSSGIEVSASPVQESLQELPTFSVEKEFVDRGQTSRSSSVSDADGEKPKLQAKLSELRSVRHSRDVRLRQDSEQRQLDLRLLQRDVANLPPEAVDQLTQAHHTFSRDSQSTSTVLLNWLRGKSTPKVVHM